MGEIRNPLVLDGRETARSPFGQGSPFYEAYSFATAHAEQRDISYAIGCARSAPVPSLAERQTCLARAAESFRYTTADLEHTVRMTGMPIRLVEDFYRQIPRLLSAPAQVGGQNRPHLPPGVEVQAEALDPGRLKLAYAKEGFCYAVTPGNDPRAAALVAANLGFLGIPFILRASPRDGAARRVITALLEAGFPPTFASLVYLNPAAADTPAKHFKLAGAASMLWTFGASQAIDTALRYQVVGKTARLDLFGLAVPQDLPALRQGLEELGLEETLRRVQLDEERIDHFAGKPVLRHYAGGCAGIAWGDLSSHAAEVLYPSIGFPAVCSAMKSLMVIDSPGWLEQAADWLEDLPVGDPMDDKTQVGFISPHTLDRLEDLCRSNACQIKTWGGKRLSEKQAQPLLVSAVEEAGDFFGQDIPAYVLAVRHCENLEDAAARLNHSSPARRLAVSLLGSPPGRRLAALRLLHTHAVMIDQPTTAFSPLLHEGNDYRQALSQGKLLLY